MSVTTNQSELVAKGAVGGAFFLNYDATPSFYDFTMHKLPRNLIIAT
jgi:hypothetical protein